MKHQKLALLFICLIVFILQGCEPTRTHEETVTIKPSNFNTLSEKEVSDGLCAGGTALDEPGPGQIIVGFFHRYNNDDDCWLNQIYEGVLRFPIDAAPFNRRLIKVATLKMHVANAKTNPSRSSCIDKMGITDVDWWGVPRTSRISINDIRNLRTVPLASNLSIDVTQEVQRWANGTEENNGFVFVGQRPEFSDFSNTGMLTNESCEAFYDQMELTVTYFQFNNPPHHPTISVNSVRTQTTTDITINGTDFTPNGSVKIYADDIPGRMGSFSLGDANADGSGKFQFFYRSLCTGQTNSATIRALDTLSGDNARDHATVFCN
jgi:hypothetical protein